MRNLINRLKEIYDYTRDYTRDDAICYCAELFFVMNYGEEEIRQYLEKNNISNCLSIIFLAKYKITVEEIMNAIKMVKIYG